MSEFTFKERTLLCLYNSAGTRTGLIAALTDMRGYLEPDEAELRNLTERAPGLLSRGGVLTAITVDHPEFPLRLLMDAVRSAVRGGMEEEQALRAVTINAAQIAGLETRIGSLAVGKDADCVLYSGNPFDYKNVVCAVLCDGKIAYRR